MSEETKEVKKSWFNRAWSAVFGVIVGIAAMFGVSQYQMNEVKTNAEKAYIEIRATIEAIQEKKYFEAIEAGKNAISTIQTITGDVKEIIDTGKDGIDEFKGTIDSLKAAIDAKDYKTALTIVNDLVAKIKAAIPEDKLSPKAKQVIDLLNQISTDLNEGKYDPVVNVVEKLVALFKKADKATDAAVEVPAEVPVAPEVPAVID